MTVWLLVGILISPTNEYKDHHVVPYMTKHECLVNKPRDHRDGEDHVQYACVKQEAA